MKKVSRLIGIGLISSSIALSVAVQANDSFCPSGYSPLPVSVVFDNTDDSNPNQAAITNADITITTNNGPSARMSPAGASPTSSTPNAPFTNVCVQSGFSDTVTGNLTTTSGSIPLNLPIGALCAGNGYSKRVVFITLIATPFPLQVAKLTSTIVGLADNPRNGS